MQTLFVELVNPADPLGFMEELINFFIEEKANTWSDDHWWNTLNSFQDTYDIGGIIRFVNEVSNDGQKGTEILMPSTYLIGLPDRIVVIRPDNARLNLFLESMRQQLAVLNLHPEHIRRLSCPFKRQRSSCCGFGRNLRGIWTSIPNKYRYKLKSPLRACLR